MVDVGAKDSTARRAVASCEVILGEALLTSLRADGFQTRKGSLVQTAVVAGIMGAKECSRLIPLCHPLPLDHCSVTVEPRGSDRVEVACTCTTTSKTGVEMEALTGASVAALTVYDMCKAANPAIEITSLRLLEKQGGKSDYQATS